MNVWLNEKLLSEAKTDTQKNTQNPIFNKIVFFDLNELDKESLLNTFKTELKRFYSAVFVFDLKLTYRILYLSI